MLQVFQVVLSKSRIFDIFRFLEFICAGLALRVSPAGTRLTVHRRLYITLGLPKCALRVTCWRPKPGHHPRTPAATRHSSVNRTGWPLPCPGHRAKLDCLPGTKSDLASPRSKPDFLPICRHLGRLRSKDGMPASTKLSSWANCPIQS